MALMRSASVSMADWISLMSQILVASVANERFFGSMKFLKSATRNPLSSEHQIACLTINKGNTSSITFDYDEYNGLFLEEKKRRSLLV